jgi:hypothetical protein
MASSAPPPDGRPSGQDQYEQRSLAYEHALEAAAVVALLAALAAILVQARIRTSLGLELRVWLPAQLRAVSVDVTARVRARIHHGLRVGAVQAATDLRAAGGPALPLPPVALDARTAAVVERLDATVRQGFADAARLAERLPAADPAGTAAVLAKAIAVANRAKADTAWVANRAINAGTAAVADAAGADLLWIAERNACLTCLALSGHTPRPDGHFDASLTFAAHPLPLFPIGNPQPLDGPPRHPHCRCTTRLWLPGSDPAFPLALQREAQRTVARGWSAHTSVPAKLTAADRLLRHPTLLPATVRHRASRAVDTGDFGT